MTTPHSTLTGSELHEPKGADTASDGQVYVANGAGSGVWTKVMGWATYADSVYTSGSPLVVNTGPTQITINGLGTGTDDTRLSNIWSTTNNRLNENVITAGDAYDIRLTFQCTVATSSQWISVELDIGGSIGVIGKQTYPLLKAGATPNDIVFSFPIFCASTFATNGGTFYINTSASTNCYDFTIHVQKTYAD